MATLATYTRRSAPLAPEAETGGLTAVLPRTRTLRSLPNEDVYFFSKRIDNSRIVREHNPQARGEWSAIGAGCAIVVLLISMLIPKLGGVLTGYQVESLKQERQRLLDERASLVVQEASLVSRERLELLAGGKGMSLSKPAPGQVIHLNPRADGSLALNVEKTSR